jgi:predicted phage tail component-like protein
LNGFTFANVTSASLGVYVKSDNRTLAPSLRKNQYIVPGKHGTLDYGGETYNNRLITIQINMVKNSMADLRTQARDVAQWLSKTGLLVFDDEPTKAYNAKVYSNIDIDQIATRGISSVTFECQPFAESLTYEQENTDITDNNAEVELTVTGTSETGCIITIKNNGLNTINGITIRRKAAI